MVYSYLYGRNTLQLFELLNIFIHNIFFILINEFFFFQGLGYHRDPQTRAAFMEVLTKILQQGTEFETLAETALADRFERLVELVTMIGDKGELPIAMALASVVATPHMVGINCCRINCDGIDI